MQKNQDPDTLKNTEEAEKKPVKKTVKRPAESSAVHSDHTVEGKKTEPAADQEAQKPAGPPKKKKLIGVFRPQNSKTGMVKPGSRPKPAGSARPAGTRPAGAPGTRPAGTAGARPVGTAGTRPAGATGTRPAGATGARPAGAMGARPAGAAGTRPTGTAGTRPTGTAETGSAATAASRPSQARPTESAGTKPAGAAGTRPTGAAGTSPAGTAAARPAAARTEEAAAHTSAPAPQKRSEPSAKTPGAEQTARSRETSGTASSRRTGAQENRTSAAKTTGTTRSTQDRRSQENRNSRSNSYAKPQAGETKPLEKESRKRQERGDRSREKGDKLERMEKNAISRSGQKNSQKTGQKNAPKKGQNQKAPAPKPVEKPENRIRTITLPERMTVSDLASALKVTPSALIKKLFLAGTMVTLNQEIEFDQAEEIALEYNCICEKEEKVDVIQDLLKEEEDPEETLVTRPPVVCVMGHVDHGKTSLLDAIRNTHEIDKEAGGITQRIGAYMVSINGQKITFLDTPGHEAFTAMRMRGANSTDIAILVVAADDGVMPQTIEAIHHAKAAGIEIIVAINKIDKPGANVERVKQELSEQGLISEDWGGSTVMVPVSAHTHEGIDDLLEMILLTAEVLELRANPNRKGRGLVIEAKLDKGKGSVATVLVQKGTLHVGDPIAAGTCYGKVRAMMDENGRRVREAGPSTPVEILGLSDVPNAGETFVCLDSEKDARSFAEKFYSEGRERMIEENRLRMSLDDLYSQIQAGRLKELDLIVKADVQGSVEAVQQSLLKLSNEEVVVKVIHSGVGAINESDVILASASNAIIIGFNVRPDASARETADREGVDVRLYNVIYDAIEDVEKAMKGMLDPIFEEKVIGHAEIRQLFRASAIGNIAGSYVTDGEFRRDCKIRISREGKQIYEGALASLKRFKDDVKEVKAGYECGLVFEKFNDIKVDDIVEAYVMVEVPR